jgi:predicted metal-dependent enzyme (double-stranded beta helix superfamily)
MPWEIAGTATEREYELLLETDHYDAWLIHWPPGTGLEAHDHGGSAGAFAIVSGVLDEDVVESDTVWSRRFVEGESVAFDDHHVHAVVNRSDAPATSVHVYWPPLRSMRFHGDDLDGRVERVGAVDVI